VSGELINLLVLKGVRILCNTMLSLSRQTAFLGILFCCFFASCRDKDASRFAVLTFKSDGSHFSGTVVRREATSITVTGAAGDAHTFLYSELANIEYGAPGNSAGAGVSAASGNRSRAAQSDGPAPFSGAMFQLPAGTVLQVTNVGMIDSAFVPVDALLLAAMDSDLKDAKGTVLIPAGANVTMRLTDKQEVAGQVHMRFELGTVDFGNRHYILSPAAGGSTSGAVATVTGAAAGSPEAKLRGPNVHLDDHGLLLFRTETPTVVKESE
jgi:hypothetical protein